MATKSASPRVLVVDDDEGLGILVTDTLQDEGIAARYVMSGRQALVQVHRSLPELLLLDLGLRDFSGVSLLNKFREEGIELPFIVVTGQGDERTAVEMMKQGALDYLIKDTAMLDRLPLVVKRALEKLESDRALASVRAALAESEQEILAISEREKLRIGADLHDNLGQQLTAVELLCHSLKADLRELPVLEARMDEICRYLRESVTQTRQLARGIMPVSLHAEGLAESLSEMVHRMCSTTVRCELVCESPVVIQNVAVASHLYHIAQEAVNNAVKHARPRSIVVTLTQADGLTTLSIADDGRGFPKMRKRGSGIGLQIMHHRANVIGASLEFQSIDKRGVHVTCMLKGASETSGKKGHISSRKRSRA